MAISVGAASNLAAFGVLSFSSTPALKTIGLVLSVGLASAWLSAMAFAKQGEKQGA
jgi:predicted exporter